MKIVKKATAILASAMLICSLCSCTEKPQESGITGAEAQEEFWNGDLEASAEKLAEFRAQSPEEVVNIWRQAKMQGNGALMYALYSADLKEVFFEKIKDNPTGWNLYYGIDAPQEVTCTDPEKMDDNDIYISDVTVLKTDGNLYYSQIFIQLVDGGYYIVSESVEYMTNEYGDIYVDINAEEDTNVMY